MTKATKKIMVDTVSLSGVSAESPSGSSSVAVYTTEISSPASGGVYNDDDLS